MDEKSIPGDIARFILAKIDSVPHLEALLLLHGTPATLWGARRVAERLYLGEAAAEKLLADLVQGGFFVRDPEQAFSFRYKPQSDAQHLMVDRVAQAYNANLVAVSRLIHSKSEGRIQEFADAFRLKKD